MNFHIDIATPAVLSGWLTPDNPSTCPRFIVRIPDRDPIEFEANVFRPDLLDLGWHATGHVGFLVDDKLIPEIASLPDVSLSEFHTGITIYRRSTSAEQIDSKLMFFDCSLMPQWRLHRIIGEHFGVQYPSIDRQPLETNLALLWNQHVSSVFASGMPNYLRYMAPLSEREYQCVALLRAPLEELAERLLFLTALSKMPRESSIRQMFEPLEEVMMLVSRTDLEKKKDIATLFRGLEGRNRDLMRSPMTRTFGAEIAEPLDRKKVAIALDHLARMRLVGRRSDYQTFSAVFDGLMQRRILSGTSHSTVPGTEELAELLRGIGPATDIIEEDLALYEFFEDSLAEMM
ncbi:MAG: hypothetical protein RKP46_19690 [Candidatus Accumulibacter sp.]|uniref:hypothetical protein n=1 Tax=Accumulibacter sp. TaxID=2053492 RepID=UPI002879F785|nr:hypothetical protein [Accumulibacter sp.]MDS4016559.1 hypothetical protein [Accumulibacter sp.]